MFFSKRLIVAGYNNANLGDDLMFATVVNSANYSNCYFYGPQLKPAFIEKDIGFIKYGRGVPIRWKLGADFALIGGSLFMGENDTHMEMFKWKLKLLRLNKLLGGKNFVLGSNLGPYRDYDEYVYALKKVVKLVDHWKVRDRYSYELLLKVGAKNVEFIPDIVMGFDLSDYYEIEPKKLISISVTDVNKDGNKLLKQDLFEKEVVELIERYHLQGYSAELVSFEDSKDLTVMERIKQKVTSSGSVELVKNIDDNVLKSIASADVVVSTRFHCMVLSALLNKSQIIYQYSQKTANFAERYGFNVYQICGDASKKTPVSTGFDAKDTEFASNMFKSMESLA
ncbi:polysaccharide pyruvyl transferase family protein [Corallincola spongiicola]|uniref:Polysaccharide pyruvyl transferase family protein n=1 Tax=Corallincola spongiicola TaxID=2520508 RepID=A0ABY1WT50_9GAMM|nr:polysaccharide pyruvyl transferase family protein [Corallincola spongiicola]TAA47751.1 polysaccharide pyruvyl transferase family protein [Corallincola spongiicola]